MRGISRKHLPIVLLGLAQPAGLMMADRNAELVRGVGSAKVLRRLLFHCHPCAAELKPPADRSNRDRSQPCA